MKVAGVLSGTSVDGIDVAILEFERDFHVLGFHSVPYPKGVREAILAISNARTETGQIARMNYLLGELFAAAVIECCAKLGLPLAGLNLIGSHGQTIFHQGDPVEMFGYQVASTMQIGEPSVIAKRTGVLVLADFRADDIAAGGQGAPLVPAVDWRIFQDREKCRIALNVGGIANITVIPAGADLEDVVACDTGPGNMVIDALMGDAGMDRDGETARRGAVDEALLAELLSDPFYAREAPKTAGREQYGPEFVKRFTGLRCEDAVATATELTVRTVAGMVNRYAAGCKGTQELIVSGGGVHNVYLMERLRAAVGMKVRTSDEFGVNVDAKEAIAFAIMAYESFHGRPGNVPGATGAKRAVILGKGCVP